MDINIQSVHFDAAEKLEQFIQKKCAKLQKRAEGAVSADFTLKLVKPETNHNKIVTLNFALTGHTIHVEKTCDTFEEAVDQCIEVVLRDLEKLK